MSVYAQLETLQNVALTLGNSTFRSKYSYVATANPEAVRQAYDEAVQGFYRKATTQAGLQRQLGLIVEYWQTCLHPNSLP